MNSEDLGFLPATELAELIRTKQLSPVEYMRALLDRITALEPKVNAFAYLAADQAMDAARAAEASADGRRADRPAARRAGHHQGPGDHQGHADPAGQPDLQGQPADRGYADGAPPAGRGRDHPGQDHDLGVRLDRRVAQPADRHHPQSVEARLQRRRVLGRRRRRGGRRVRPAAPGQRRRRLDPHAGAFLRRVRPEAELRPGAVLSRSAPATSPRTSAR